MNMSEKLIIMALIYLVSGQEAHHPVASTHSDWDGLEERASHQHPYGFGKLIP